MVEGRSPPLPVLATLTSRSEEAPPERHIFRSSDEISLDQSLRYLELPPIYRPEQVGGDAVAHPGWDHLRQFQRRPDIGIGLEGLDQRNRISPAGVHLEGRI